MADRLRFAAKAYRHFCRLVRITMRAARHGHLCCAGIELYGRITIIDIA